MPKFDMRVVQIDLARQIETVETVCRYMDVAAIWTLPPRRV